MSENPGNNPLGTVARAAVSIVELKMLWNLIRWGILIGSLMLWWVYGFWGGLIVFIGTVFYTIFLSILVRTKVIQNKGTLIFWVLGWFIVLLFAATMLNRPWIIGYIIGGTLLLVSLATLANLVMRFRSKSVGSRFIQTIVLLFLALAGMAFIGWGVNYGL